MNTVILLGVICCTICCIIWWEWHEIAVVGRSRWKLAYDSLCALLRAIFRMLPMLISYFFIKKFKLNIKFGRFSLPLSLRAVKIIKNGFSIVSRRVRQHIDDQRLIAKPFCSRHLVSPHSLQQIDEVNIRSSFFSSDVNKFLSITIRDIRVNKDINEASATDSDDGVDNGPSADTNFGIFDFRNKHVSPSIIKFAQVRVPFAPRTLSDINHRFQFCSLVWHSSCPSTYRTSRWWWWTTHPIRAGSCTQRPATCTWTAAQCTMWTRWL